MKLMRPAAHILQAVASGSYSAYCTILDTLLPLQINQLCTYKEPSPLCATMQVMKELINLSNKWDEHGWLSSVEVTISLAVPLL